MGSVTLAKIAKEHNASISTHTLRGERDLMNISETNVAVISTHTLRGERDELVERNNMSIKYFNSHAPWGA